VQAHRTAQVRWRCDTFIEDPDLGGVAYAKDDPVDSNTVFELKLANDILG
jgi:hypothetical protein